MQADWEVEIGGEAPVIESHWPGFIDLRKEPQKAWSLAESTQLPGLAAALVRVNSSSFWTSKCDVWPVVEFDRDELDAPQQPSAAMACYIDLLPRDSTLWPDHEDAVRWCRSLCASLQGIPLSSCRADCVVRRAFVPPAQTALGMTAYLTACGNTVVEAVSRLGAAVAAFADAVVDSPSRASIGSSLQ
jgi:hypothetical protein